MYKKILFMFVAVIMAFTATAAHAAGLGGKLSGKLLLQVNQGGRIWYVAPQDNNRYEVTFKNALPLFRKFAVGITNANLNKIRIAPDSLDDFDYDHDGVGNKQEVLNGSNPFGPGSLPLDSTFAAKHKGKLFLQVEEGGRIWYVDFNGERWEITWDNLMNRFQKLALGISDSDLSQIIQGDVNSSNTSQSSMNTNYSVKKSSVGTTFFLHDGQDNVYTFDLTKSGFQGLQGISWKGDIVKVTGHYIYVGFKGNSEFVGSTIIGSQTFKPFNSGYDIVYRYDPIHTSGDVLFNATSFEGGLWYDVTSDDKQFVYTAVGVAADFFPDQKIMIYDSAQKKIVYTYRVDRKNEYFGDIYFSLDNKSLAYAAATYWLGYTLNGRVVKVDISSGNQTDIVTSPNQKSYYRVHGWNSGNINYTLVTGP